MTAIMLTSGPASADQPPGVYTVKDGDKVDDKSSGRMEDLARNGL